MKSKRAHAANDGPEQPAENIAVQEQQVAVQGEQGDQRIYKICLLCNGGNRMWSLNWARHMKNIHPGQQGIQNVDWCYEEEMPMNPKRQDDQQQDASPIVQQDKLKNTLCTQCQQFKRKRDFPELKDVKPRGQQLAGVCIACKSWVRKRDNKGAQKEEAKENKEQQVNLPQPPVVRDPSSLASLAATLKDPNIARMMSELTKIIQQQNEKIQKLEEAIARKENHDFVSSLLLKPSDTQFQKHELSFDKGIQLQFQNNIECSQDIWHQSGQIEVLPELISSQPVLGRKPLQGTQQLVANPVLEPINKEVIEQVLVQEISHSQKQDGNLHRASVSEEQKKQDVDVTTGKIEEATIKQFIEEHRDKFAKLGMNNKNLTQLVGHPVTIDTKKRQRIKAEDYFLLDPTIKAFTDLVKLRAGETVVGIRLFDIKEFQTMMKNYKLGIFKNITPDIEDQDKHIILPYYNEKHCHWCFIIVDINHQGEGHKIYIVDSVSSFQSQHRREITKEGNTWCNMVRCWIEHQFDRSNNHCSFEVLNIKNQDNNFDCGLLLCLLIWQFFQTQEVLDLVAFPWKKEFSHHYRFAVARAIFQQDLAPIEQLVQAKKEVLASM